MSTSRNNESEIKSWLKATLKEENIDDFNIKVLGNSEKGDGYAGDIIFVSLNRINGNGLKNYDLVLKCSKRSEALREQLPMKDVFMNEIYIYDVLLPEFTQFQLDRGVTAPFDTVPTCYGTLVTDDMEILVFENLKKIGYDLWNKKKPLTRKHIDMIVGEYAKFHAVSIAMQDQQPEKFNTLSKGLISDLMQRFFKDDNVLQTMFGNNIDLVRDLLKDHLDEELLLKWSKLKEKLHFIFNDMNKEMDGLKVILHGDSWSNNFLFKHKEDNITPSNVAILDWQISQLSSPVLELSYFLFASISEDDIEQLDDILRYYYESLDSRVKSLGSNLASICTFEQLLTDWRNYCKYGIAMSSALMKVYATDKNEVVDMAEAAEKGAHFSKMFEYDVKDVDTLKNRSRHIVKYVVERALI